MRAGDFAGSPTRWTFAELAVIRAQAFATLTKLRRAGSVEGRLNPRHSAMRSASAPPVTSPGLRVPCPEPWQACSGGRRDRRGAARGRAHRAGQLPVLAVGQAAIDLTPPPVKDFAISTFGTADKTVLSAGILVLLALYAAAVGILAVRRLAFGMWGSGCSPLSAPLLSGANSSPQTTGHGHSYSRLPRNTQIPIVANP